MTKPSDTVAEVEQLVDRLNIGIDLLNTIPQTKRDDNIDFLSASEHIKAANLARNSLSSRIESLVLADICIDRALMANHRAIKKTLALPSNLQLLTAAKAWGF